MIETDQAVIDAMLDKLKGNTPVQKLNRHQRRKLAKLIRVYAKKGNYDGK